MNLRTSLGVLTVLIVSVACGQANSGVVVRTQAPVNPPAPEPVVIHGVGDVIQFGDHTLTMTSGRISGDSLQTSYTVTNTGAGDVNVSSLINFDARLPDGTKLEVELFNCPGANLDGRVLAGESLKGGICWKGVSGNVVKVYYVANIFDKGATVWEVRR